MGPVNRLRSLTSPLEKCTTLATPPAPEPTAERTEHSNDRVAHLAQRLLKSRCFEWAWGLLLPNGMRFGFIAAWLTMLTAGVGCAGRAADGPQGNAGNDAGSADATTVPPCPESASAGQSCAADGMLCTYGDAVLARCREVLVCQESSFTLLPAAENCATTSCSPEARTGVVACAAEGDTCAYEDGTLCACSSCISALGGCNGSNPWWHCRAPAAPPCPSTLPNAGTQCSTATSCVFATDNGSLIDGVCAVCHQGTWEWFPAVDELSGPRSCPTSPSCEGACVGGSTCPAGSEKLYAGVCSIGNTCCSQPKTCVSTGQCGTLECCLEGLCRPCGGPCATEHGFCVDSKATCDAQRQDAPAPVELTSCAGGPCCLDPARSVCCYVNPGG